MEGRVANNAMLELPNRRQNKGKLVKPFRKMLTG